MLEQYRRRRRPVFDLMDHYPRKVTKGLEDTPKSEIVTDVGAVLEAFDVQAPLANDVAYHARTLGPLLELIYQRLPGKKHPIRSEGRGVYHDHIPVGDQEATVYVKGVGAQLMVKPKPGVRDIPGFPTKDSDMLMFDRIGPGSHQPRILGAQALAPAFLEFVTAAAIFAYVAKKEGWNAIGEAVEAGVTIPLGVAAFPHLSHRLQERLTQQIDTLPDGDEKKAFSWEGNFNGHGSVGLIVPGDERVDRLWSRSRNQAFAQRHNDQVLPRLRNDEITINSARTQRRLLEMGIVYPRESAHGQNLYTKGYLAQADNTDVLFLGDFDGHEKRAALIFNQLIRNDSLVPLVFVPVGMPITTEEVQHQQQVFWREFLKGVAHPDAIKKLSILMPVLRDQINLGAALLMAEKFGNNGVWDDLAAKRREVIERFDTFGTGEHLRQDIEYAFPQEREASFRARMKVGQVMKEFLETGDSTVLSRDPEIKLLADVAYGIDAVSDKKEKEKLVQNISVLQYMRYTDDSIGFEYDEADDVIDNRHFDLILQKLTMGDIKSASTISMFLKIINEFIHTKDDMSHEEPSRYFFANMLLTQSGSLRRILEFGDKVLRESMRRIALEVEKKVAA